MHDLASDARTLPPDGKDRQHCLSYLSIIMSPYLFAKLNMLAIPLLLMRGGREGGGERERERKDGLAVFSSHERGWVLRKLAGLLNLLIISLITNRRKNVGL